MIKKIKQNKRDSIKILSFSKNKIIRVHNYINKSNKALKDAYQTPSKNNHTVFHVK